MTLGDRVAVLRNGVLQQVASPEDLYDAPGEPLRRRVHRLARDEPRRGRRHPCTTGGSSCGSAKDKSWSCLRLADELAGLARFEGQPVVLGIRPEDIEDASSSRAVRRAHDHRAARHSRGHGLGGVRSTSRSQRPPPIADAVAEALGREAVEPPKPRRRDAGGGGSSRDSTARHARRKVSECSWPSKPNGCTSSIPPPATRSTRTRAPLPPRALPAKTIRSGAQHRQLRLRRTTRTASSMPTSLPACSERNQRCSSTWWKTSAAGSAAHSSSGTAATVGSNTSSRQRDATTDSGSGRFSLPLERLAVARDVVQHPARLVLLRVEAGQPQQAMAVVARLDDVRVEPQPVAVRRRVELDLLDVEAELVQPVQPLVELVALVGARTSPRA